MHQLIKELKENNQDFEFYPTTYEMVDVVYRDIARKSRNDTSYSLLDVGCGNGNVFTILSDIREKAKKYNINLGMGEDEDTYFDRDKVDYFEENMYPKATITEKFGIEKSEILIKNLPSDVIIVGTDFWNSTLIDKKVDIIFSNPPYSQFEEWSVKILKEAYASVIYLIIPERWKNSKEIKEAIKSRNFKYEVLSSMDFLEGDRKARAKIDIVKIVSEKSTYRYYNESDDQFSGEPSDPFDIWFDSEFISGEQFNIKTDELDHKEKIENELSTGRNLIEILVDFYTKELNQLIESYQSISKINSSLLKELGVSHENLKKGLKEKIKGLKYNYWHELFNNLDKIKQRLTSDKRKKLLDKLYKNVSIDFTIANVYAVVIWVIKNSNQYFDDQLRDMYIRLTEKEYIKNYKSNQRTWGKDNWRYNKSHTHYTLDYRIITRDYKDYFGKSDLLSDISTIANNLGFSEFGESKSFQNGNVHLKFNKDFMKAFNIEAARLFGWIKNKQDISKEFDNSCDITDQDISKYFRGNYLLKIDNPTNLLSMNKGEIG